MAYNGIQVWQKIFDFSQSSSTGLKPVRGPASPSEISGSKSWVFSACIVMRCVFQSLSQLLAYAPSISISATNQLWKSSQADAVNLIKLNWNLSQWPEKKSILALEQWKGCRNKDLQSQNHAAVLTMWKAKVPELGLKGQHFHAHHPLHSRAFTWKILAASLMLTPPVYDSKLRILKISQSNSIYTSKNHCDMNWLRPFRLLDLCLEAALFSIVKKHIYTGAWGQHISLRLRSCEMMPMVIRVHDSHKVS